MKVFSHKKLQNRRIRNWPSKKISMCMILKKPRFFVIYFNFFPPCVPKHWKVPLRFTCQQAYFRSNNFKISATKTMKICKVCQKWVKLHAKTPIKYPFLMMIPLCTFAEKSLDQFYFCSISTRLSTTPYVVCLYVYRSTFSGSDNFKIIKSFPDGNDSFSHFTYVIRGTHGLLIL